MSWKPTYPTYKRLDDYSAFFAGSDNATDLGSVRDMAHEAQVIHQMIIAGVPSMRAIARHLHDGDRLQCLYNVWHFTKENLKYRYDDRNTDGKVKEQIRMPLRSWADRRRGVDCEDYTIFICAILSAMGYRPTFNIVKFKNSGQGWSHIYPTLDGVCCDILTAFAVHPKNITETMAQQIEVLRGTDRESKVEWLKMADAESRPLLVELMPYVDRITTGGSIVWKPGAPVARLDEMMADHLADIANGGDGLGSLQLFRRNPRPKPKPNERGPRRGVGSTALKILPSMILGRTAFLELIRTNAFRLAQKFRLLYLTTEQAEKAGLDMDKWTKYKARKSKIEKTWTDLGGDLQKFKQAISKGAHVPIDRLGDPTIAGAAAVAAPVIVAITAAIGGTDFKGMTDKSKDKAMQLEDGEAIAGAVKGVIAKLKERRDRKKDKDADAELQVLDQAAEIGGAETNGSGNRPPTPPVEEGSNKGLIYGLLALAVIGGGIALASR